MTINGILLSLLTFFLKDKISNLYLKDPMGIKLLSWCLFLLSFHLTFYLIFQLVQSALM